MPPKDAAGLPANRDVSRLGQAREPTRPVQAGLVDVPCTIVYRNHTSLTISAFGRRVTLSQRDIVQEDHGGITVYGHVAAAHGLTTTAQCIGVDELAARFGYNRDWIYRNIDRLIAEDHFPLPVTSVGRRIWDQASVDAWFARYHPEKAKPEAVTVDLADDARVDQARLADAYGAR